MTFTLERGIVFGMYSCRDLRILARAYLKAAQITEHELGARILNGKFISRLLAGSDILASSAEQASRFFDTHWPEGAPWPPRVKRPETKRCTAAAK